jgi:Fe-S-cluster containining protein
VGEEEIGEMAQFLGISKELFFKKYIRQKGNRFSLTEKKNENYSCVFLKQNQCTVYGARPKQCRTYPFWPQNLSSKEAWEKTAQECEGIHPAAPIISLEQIQKNLSKL